jgi:transmembrane sensor
VIEPADTCEPRALLDDALGWIARLKAGEPSAVDLEELQHWRAQSPLHEEAFREAVRVWRLVGTAGRELAEEASQKNASPPQIMSQSRALSRRVFVGGAIAASVAGVAVLHPPLDLWPSLQELSADYRTGKGERRMVALAPDVSLEMNTQTSIAVKPTQSALQIELVSGQTAVSVDLPQTRPLVVLAAGSKITASRARFDARCINGVVSVSCLEGSVSVAQGEFTLRFGKDEQVSYGADGVMRSSRVDPRRVTAWREGLLLFHDTPLVEVIEEVNRYRPGKIIIANADLSRRIVDGVFRVDRLEVLVEQVQRLFGARALALPGGVVLLG